MRYTFGTKINGTEESGIIDMDTLMVVCICPESNSELILQALNLDPVVGRSEQLCEICEPSNTTKIACNQCRDR